MKELKLTKGIRIVLVSLLLVIVCTIVISILWANKAKAYTCSGCGKTMIAESLGSGTHQYICSECNEVGGTESCDSKGLAYNKYTDGEHWKRTICSVCGGRRTSIAEPHDKVILKYEKNNTSHIVHYKCGDCGYDEFPTLTDNHEYNSSGVCTVCGYSNGSGSTTPTTPTPTQTPTPTPTTYIHI